MDRILAALAALGILAFAAVFVGALRMASPPAAPTDDHAATLEAECSYVATAGARAFDAATEAIWRQHGPGLPLEYVDVEALNARRK